jgi:hypothetical protein
MQYQGEVMWAVYDINMNLIRAFDFKSDALLFANECVDEEVSVVFDPNLDPETFRNYDEED